MKWPKIRLVWVAPKICCRCRKHVKPYDYETYTSMLDNEYYLCGSCRIDLGFVKRTSMHEYMKKRMVELDNQDTHVL